ncbi:MAG: hypothetical protein ACOVN9_12505, partial [Inhella sp.]
EGGAGGLALTLLQAMGAGVPKALRAHHAAALARAAERMGDFVLAREALRKAIAFASHEAEARMLSARLAAL